MEDKVNGKNLCERERVSCQKNVPLKSKFETFFGKK